MNIYSDCYYIDRESGAYGDSLAAFGLAKVLSSALGNSGLSTRVAIKNLGTSYSIHTAVPITPEIIANATYPDELLPFIQNDPHPEHAKHFPLGEYMNLLRSKTKDVVEDANGEQALQAEIPDTFNVYGLIEQLQGDGLQNRLATRLWVHREHYSNFLEFALSVYCETPNQIGRGKRSFAEWRKRSDATDFETEDSLLAIFSPTWQKSINRPKPDTAENKNSKGFWLPEYLKMVGMPHCALVVSVRSGSSKFSDEDKKVYVLAPNSVELQSHDAIMKMFRAGIFRAGIYRTSSIRADIEVLFKYVSVFLLWVEQPAHRLTSRKRITTLDGFFSAYFKKSSRQRSGLSITNLPYLALPTWIEFDDAPTDQDIQNYNLIIEEQQSVLWHRFNNSGSFEDFLDENKSEGYELLRYYRDFLSGGNIPALLCFFSGFAEHLLKQMSRQNPEQQNNHKQFSTVHLRRLFELLTPLARDNPLTLEHILNDDGFREIARAIRLSTVTAQRFKTKKIPWHHEIRYGFAQEIKRKAMFKSHFITAIMQFINQYQAENARARERDKSNLLRIHELTTEHIRKFAALVDACPGDGVEPIASMLLAFGYAYDNDPKEKDPEGNEPQAEIKTEGAA